MPSSEYLVYPKQFHKRRIPIKGNQVFVLMPFSADMDNIYAAIKSTLDEMGLLCSRADEIAGSRAIMEKVLFSILESGFLIAEMTGTNPNVFYELGIAHSFKDLSNILLLRQATKEKAPIDISHLTYIEYDPNDLPALGVKIKQFIRAGKVFNDFQDALDRNRVVDDIEDPDAFIDYVKETLGQKTELLVAILNDEIPNETPLHLKHLIEEFREIMRQAIEGKESRWMPAFIKIYAIMLKNISTNAFGLEYVREVLGGFFDPFEVSDANISDWQTSVAIMLAEDINYRAEVTSWIINYFSRPKTTSIDLNRHKLERFLLLADSSYIDEAIIDALRDDDAHIREFMADFIGEKRLESGKRAVAEAIKGEVNPYAARSMLHALGIIGDESTIQVIEEVVRAKEDEWKTQNYTTTFRHAYMAIAALDVSGNRAEAFYAQYAKYIDDGLL